MKPTSDFHEIELTTLPLYSPYRLDLVCHICLARISEAIIILYGHHTCFPCGMLWGGHQGPRDVHHVPFLPW